MLKFRISIFLLIAIFLINSANAATIYGNVYDLSLKKVNNARVEINTIPKQFLIAQNSSYSFNAPNGFYTIKAQLIQKNSVLASVDENITIRQEGDYVLDLILFPDVEEGVEDINADANSSLIETKAASTSLIIFTALTAFLAIFIAILFFKKRKKTQQKLHETKQEQQEKSEDDDLEQLIKIIRHEGGRATQKDIRKQIPLSEAKISLMIAELEHKGIIEKIKKGRGNIIILKRR